MKQVISLHKLSDIPLYSSTIPWMSIFAVIVFSGAVILAIYILPVWIVIQLQQVDFNVLTRYQPTISQINLPTYNYIVSTQNIHRLLNVSRC